MTWKYEHGDDYDVPEAAILAAGLEDHSWHNDACPSFSTPAMNDPRGEHDLRLWVEHPDKAQRESGMEGRFTVNYQPWSNDPIPGVIHCEDGDVYCGDDLEAALKAYADAQAIIVAHKEASKS